MTSTADRVPNRSGRPLISVVVPAHNAASTVGATLSSILWQTYPRIEVVIVDDGSTDDTARIVEAYRDPRVRLTAQNNGGPGAARNRGMSMVGGDFIAFVDADDILMPEYLQACMDVWSPDRTFVTSNAYWMFAGGIDPRRTRHTGPLPAPSRQRLALLEHNWVSVMSVFPREMLHDIDGFDEALDRAEDWDFWLRAVYAGWTVKAQRRPLALFNRTGITLTSAGAKVIAAERQILERMQQRADLSRTEREYLVRRLAAPPLRLLTSAADADIRAGRWRDARRRYRQAAGLAPSNVPLLRKARFMTVAPSIVGPMLRHRDARRREAEQIHEPDSAQEYV